MTYSSILEMQRSEWPETLIRCSSSCSMFVVQLLSFIVHLTVVGRTPIIQSVALSKVRIKTARVHHDWSAEAAQHSCNLARKHM